MDISYLSGLDGTCAGLGAAGKGKAKVQKFVKKTTSVVTKGVAKVGFAAGRNLFLFLLKNNIDGLASNLNTGNRERQVSFWKKVGGDSKVFAEAIKKGSSKPAKKMGFLQKLKGLSTKKKLSGFGSIGETVDKQLESKIVALATSLGATLGTAVPAAGTAAGAGGGASLGAVIVAIFPIIQEAVAKVPVAEALDPDKGGFNIPPATEKADEEKETSATPETGLMPQGAKQGIPMIAIAAAAAAALYFISKKKK